MVDSRFTQNPQKHFKRNFSDVMEYLIPRYYILEDRELAEDQIDVFDQVINSHIELALNITSVLETPTGEFFEDLQSISGIAPFFDKKNNFTDCDKLNFEKTILYPLNKSFLDFQTSSSIVTYLKDELIPYFRSTWTTASSVDYYTNHLGWFYLLSTSSTETTQPSSIALDYMSRRLISNQALTLADGVNALTEFVWKNNLPYIPSDFLQGSDEYTNQEQQLEKLKTINEVLYSRDYIDRLDSYVSDSFDIYDQTNTYNENLVNNGPFWRLLKAFSLSFADMQNEANQLEALYDLQDCPDEYLQELAYLIGWKLTGYDRNKWRLQLANALSVYKKTGTKQSIQIALDNFFGKDAFNLDSHLTELWESYLPFLIMYALATESPHFKDFSTYTREVADGLGIRVYDSKDFESNIRSAVDQILFLLFQEFPSNFTLAGQPFPVNSEDFVFRYRGAVHPIPPFEEIPYYITSDITKPFLNYLKRLLVCFGVSNEFATSLIDYVTANTLENKDDLYLGSTWLIFTESLQYPPNWDDLIAVPDKRKIQYLSLWNGKSSHFRLDFSADQFNFSQVRYTPDSKYAILLASRTAQEFAPAHAVPVVHAHLSDSSDYSGIASGYLFTQIERDPQEYPNFSNNYRDRGVNILASQAVPFLEFSGLGRQRLSSLFGPSGTVAVSSNGTVFSAKEFGPTFNVNESNNKEIFNIPRRSTRRRNFKNAINLTNFYDRTGLNPPIFRASKIPGLTAEEDNKLITKGLIPSSLDFVSVSADCSGLVSSIPNIYMPCPPNRGGLFYGYYLSSVLPTRGANAYDTELTPLSMHEDRGQFDPFMYVLYKIEQQKIAAEAYEYVSSDPQAYVQTSYWMNVSGSEANKRLSCQETVLSSIEGYYDYSLGRKIHKLYNDYVSGFNYHPLTRVLYENNPRNIINHCFGSIIANNNFETRGTNGNLYYTSSVDDIKLLNLRSDTFGPTLANGSLAVTASDFTVVPAGSLGTEIVNSTIIKDVDIIHTSGTSVSNNFTIYDFNDFQEDSYFKSNAVIKLKAVNGLPRLRFHISGTDLSEGYGSFRNSSFLTPNHEFKVTLKGLAALDDGSQLLDSVELGVWIHTKAVNNRSYHYTKDGEWVSLSKNQINLQTVVNDLCHKVFFEKKAITEFDEVSALGRCIRVNNDPEADNTPSEPILSFTQDMFSETSVTFNTFFGCGTNGIAAAHDFDQHYIVEVFMIPKRDNQNKFALLDHISLRDETLWDYTRLQFGGEPVGALSRSFCNSTYMDLSQDDVTIILQTFARLAGKGVTYGRGALGRNNNNYIHPTHLNNGGSRESYRLLAQQVAINSDLGNDGEWNFIDINNPESNESILESFASQSQIVEAIETVPPEGEAPLIEGLPFGLWIG